ncbi:MAG: GDP-mannose 4,6-dehydratase [Clostridiales bacterium]|nr:GDP-mannose 4,6-dehydratase [Clostridiales bacterium]
MKKALIIGAAGFVGDYLIDHIQKNCIWSITVTKLPQETILKKGIEILDLNLMEPTEVTSLLNRVEPDYIFHLAAQSSVALSWKNPDLTVDVNIKGTIHLLEAIRHQKKQPRILLIGSGEEYGHVLEDEIPITEATLPRPGNIYAATKACQNMIGKIYCDAYHMDIMSVRAFNHIGPNQAPLFVVSDFCKQTAEIERGDHEPVISVGNLSARRDFTDVRDVVRAYVLLMEKGISGEIYNVGSGTAVSIQSILDTILQMSDRKIRVSIDPTKLRPVDVPVIEADIHKLQAVTGWEPEFTLSHTLAETLDYWRRQ